MDMNYSGGMWEGGGVQGGRGEGGKWDNCNSIINKYIKKTKKQNAIILRLTLLIQNPKESSRKLLELIGHSKCMKGRSK